MGIIRNFINIEGITLEDDLLKNENGHTTIYSDTEALFFPKVKIKSIYEVIMSIDISSHRSIKTPIGRIIVLDGVKRYKIMYTQDGELDRMFIVNHESPFNTFIESPVDFEDIWSIDIHIIDAYFSLINKESIYGHFLLLLDINYETLSSPFSKEFDSSSQDNVLIKGTPIKNMLKELTISESHEEDCSIDPLLDLDEEILWDKVIYMKICYDGIGMSHFTNTGLYSYTFELLDRLTSLYPQAQYKVISNKDIKPHALLGKKVDFHKIDLNRKRNNYKLLEEYITKNNVTIYHSPNNGFSFPDKKVCKYVLTLHNLLPLSYPRYVDRKYYNKYKSIVPISLDKADKIIAVSNFIKNEIHTHFDIPENKVIVVYPILSRMFTPIDQEVCNYQLEKKYRIQGDFLLYTGSIHERKHLDLLLIVFRRLLPHYNNLKLVIAGNNKGKKNVYYLRLKELARRLGITSRIYFIGLVNYRDMPYLYNNALCTITLSDYEGFPISSLESLACGTSVICSDTSSFKEILGKSAVYIDNRDIYSFEKALFKIIQEKNTDFKKTSVDVLRHKENDSIRQLVRVYESIG